MSGAIDTALQRVALWELNEDGSYEVDSSDVADLQDVIKLAKKYEDLIKRVDLVVKRCGEARDNCETDEELAFANEIEALLKSRLGYRGLPTG